MSLTEVIDLLARQLKINYILDPRVKGGVMLNTYGETKDIDTRSLLETILRINGFGIVKQGDLYRIVPLTEISHLPVPVERVRIPKTSPTTTHHAQPGFLKYVTADELAKIWILFWARMRALHLRSGQPDFPAGQPSQHARLMELVSLFDSDTLANQRVRLFEVKNGQPSDLGEGTGKHCEIHLAERQKRTHQVHPGQSHQYDHRGRAQSRRFYGSGEVD